MDFSRSKNYSDFDNKNDPWYFHLSHKYQLKILLALQVINCKKQVLAYGFEN